jgi:hypothetical protein
MEFPYEEDNKLYHQWCLPQEDAIKNRDEYLSLTKGRPFTIRL